MTITAADLVPYGYPANGAICPPAKCRNGMLWRRAIEVRWLAIYRGDLPDTHFLVKNANARIKSLTKKLAAHDKAEKDFCEKMGWEYQPR